MKNFSCFLLGVALLLPPPSAAGQVSSGNGTPNLIPPEIVMGRTATVTVAGRELAGELLAVSQNTLWLRSGTQVTRYSLRDVMGVNVQMHKWGGKRALIWSVAAGLGSAAAMTGACTTVRSDCGAVFFGVSASWALAGGLLGTLLDMSSRQSVPRNQEALRRYVRYPQGLPPGTVLPDSVRGTVRR